jgi:hypothetical protein
VCVSLTLIPMSPQPLSTDICGYRSRLHLRQSTHNTMSDLPSAIHPDIHPRLDPEYVAIHNEHIAHLVPPHTIPWHPDIRNSPYTPSSSPVRTVGAVKNIQLQNCKIRAFIPEGTPPPEGWPVLLYIHGGESHSLLGEHWLRVLRGMDARGC